MATSRERYHIKVLSHLDKHWHTWPIVKMEHVRDPGHGAMTVLEIHVTDQGAMLGVLGDLCGLGLRLVSVDLAASPGRKHAI